MNLMVFDMEPELVQPTQMNTIIAGKKTILQNLIAALRGCIGLLLNIKNWAAEQISNFIQWVKRKLGLQPDEYHMIPIVVEDLPGVEDASQTSLPTIQDRRNAIIKDFELDNPLGIYVRFEKDGAYYTFTKENFIRYQLRNQDQHAELYAASVHYQL